MEEKDLGALIENGLNDLAVRIDESRLEARQHFKQLGVEIHQTRTHLEGQIQQLDGKIDQTRTHLEGQIQQTRTQLEAQIRRLDDKIRIQLEHVHGGIRLVAEGVANVNEKLDRHVGETAHEFDDVRALTRLSYVQLEQRVTRLESVKKARASS